jgi:peptidoglycan/xylan/chitin deacetylase (PgdA/CDA1 family)
VNRRELLAAAGKRAGGVVAAVPHAILGNRAPGAFGILMYHRVCHPGPGPGSRPTVNVRPATFRRQLEGLVEQGHRFLPLGEVLTVSAQGGALPPNTVVVTFDDGYASVRTEALPVLQALGIPATVFVATAFIGRREPFPFDPWGRAHAETVAPADWRPLTWAECAELESSGLVEIGSHSHTHADLRSRPDEFETDVATSVGLLDERLRRQPRPFAFPYGSVRSGFAGPALREAARRAGVTCGLTTEIELVRPGQDPFGWGRIEAVDSDGPAVLAAKLGGWYAWMGPARRLFQKVVPR